MREIKFRGRDIEGKWLYGDLINSKINSTPTAFIFPADAPNSYDRYSVNPNTIGQFTGLKDKNGKDIYEGDIVRKKEIGGYGYEYIGVVRYYEKDCRYAIDITATNEFSTRELFTVGESVINDGYCTIKYTTEYEILGNVYDNPELLNGKNE